MGGELSRTDANDIKSETTENYRDVKPKNEMTIKELKDAVIDEFNKAAKEVELDMNNDSTEKNLNPIHKDCKTSSEERKELANRSNGEWDGEPGDSKFRPEKQEAKEALERYKQDGVDYIDGEPDFSKVSEATVEIDNMTSERYGLGNNFDQANQKCAEKWNKEAKDGKTDWTAREVENWRKENHYTWHERLDRKTMDLVQSDIHEECKHYGGVAECKRFEATEKQSGGGFDV